MRPQRRMAQTILPLYHPSYALHNPTVRPVLRRDIQTLTELLRARGGAAPE